MVTAWQDDLGGDLASQCMFASTPSEFAFLIGKRSGSEQAKSCQLSIADSGAVDTMTSSKQDMRDYQEWGKNMVNVNGVTFLIKGYRKLCMLPQIRKSDWIESLLPHSLD